MKGVRALFQPDSVAVIGASAKPDSLGCQVLANLQRGSFKGPVLPVNPAYKSVQRQLCWPSVDDLPVVPELAVLCTPPGATLAALAKLAERGTKAAVVMTADPDGRRPGTAFKRDLAALAKGIRILGPASSGFQAPGIGLDASAFTTACLPGKLAMVSQSASIAASAVEWAAGHGIGFSAVVSTGDGVDVGLPEIFDYLASDLKTRAVLLYLREVDDTRAFLSAARSLARIKPVLAIKPVQPGTDRLADEAWTAAFRRAGILRVADTGEWFDAVETLGFGKVHTAERLAVLSNGDGPALPAAAAVAAEGRLAELHPDTLAKLAPLVPGGQAGNPVDIGRIATAERYAQALAALLGDPQVGAVLAIHSPSHAAAAEAVAKAVAEAAKKTQRQVLTAWLGKPAGGAVQEALTAALVPLYDTPEKAARAFLNLAHYRRCQEALMELPAARPSRREDAETGLLLHDEAETKAVLAAYGTIVRHILMEEPAIEPDEALPILAAYGFATGEERGMRLPLKVAAASDPALGRIIVLEGAGRRAVALPPLNMALAAPAVAEVLPAAAAAFGAPLAAEPVQALLINLADFLIELPEVASLEMDNLAADRGEIVVRSARLTVAEHAPKAAHLAIRPYPHRLEERLTLKDGRQAVVRPIRPEDEPLYRDMLSHVEPGDLFLRFCTRFGGETNSVPTELLAKLIQIDYDRDMSFIALVQGDDGQPVALGVVDSMASADRSEAEFSICLRSDLKGTGLGKALMEKIIGYVAAQGVETLMGVILRNNQPMRGLCTKLGFKTTIDPDDDMVKVTLELARPT